MPKDLIFIRADQIAIPDSDVDAFQHMCYAYGVDLKRKEVKSEDDIEDALSGIFKYICFAGHGDECSFGNESDLSLSWDRIGEIICQKNCLHHNGIVILFCCKGGLTEVGCKLIESCPNLDFIVGVPENENSLGLLTAYSIFIYNLEINRLDEEESIHRAICGTGIKIEHFYRGHRDAETGEYKCLKCEELNAGMESCE